MHKSTVSHCVGEPSRYFYVHQKKYMTFPMSRQERQGVASQYYHRHGKIPLCLGCVDGTHIPILSPKNNEKAYLNRKHYHSLNAMIISNAEKIITHLNARWPGRINDAYILRESIIHELGEADELGNYYFLGDSGYPLRPYLYTPIANPASPAERRYNRWLKTNSGYS